MAEPAGCPNASLEAMAAGLPVIATDVGGMSEQVEDGVTGRLVGREDVEGLAAAVVEAASDRDRRAAWGEAGKRRVAERFGLERMIAEYHRVCLDGREPLDAIGITLTKILVSVILEGMNWTVVHDRSQSFSSAKSVAIR